MPQIAVKTIAFGDNIPLSHGINSPMAVPITVPLRNQLIAVARSVYHKLVTRFYL